MKRSVSAGGTVEHVQTNSRDILGRRSSRSADCLLACPRRFFSKILSFAARLSSTENHNIALDKCLPSVLVFDPNRMQQASVLQVLRTVRG